MWGNNKPPHTKKMLDFTEYKKRETERNQLKLWNNPPISKRKLADMTSFFKKLENEVKTSFKNEFGFYNPYDDGFPENPTTNDLLTLTQYIRENPKAYNAFRKYIDLYMLDITNMTPKQKAIRYLQQKERERMLSIWTRQFFKRITRYGIETYEKENPHLQDAIKYG